MLLAWHKEQPIKNEPRHDLEMLVKVIYATTCFSAAMIPAPQPKEDIQPVVDAWKAVLALPPWNELYQAASGVDYAALKKLISTRLPCLPLPTWLLPLVPAASASTPTQAAGDQQASSRPKRKAAQSGVREEKKRR